jgi:predicted permease
MQQAGSLMILVGPVLLSAAFFVEPGLAGLERPFTRPAVIAAFAGLLLHVLAISHAAFLAQAKTRNAEE